MKIEIDLGSEEAKELFLNALTKDGTSVDFTSSTLTKEEYAKKYLKAHILSVTKAALRKTADDQTDKKLKEAFGG